LLKLGNGDRGAHGFPLHAQEAETPFPDLEAFLNNLSRSWLIIIAAAWFTST
jgi:hypothetical protein